MILRSELLFAPSSLYWRVNREWLISFAGPRALLLELAHPAVAAGVARHSNYQGDPFGRLYRTMKTMTEISFGDETERRIALRHFHRCHARVNGTTQETRYDARDSSLQFWVLATLIDSVPRAYEKFVAPLSLADKCAYYDDCVRLARLLGISSSVIPATYRAFEEYMHILIHGNTLHVTDDARAVVNALFAPTLRGNATRWFSFASIGMLPPRLRKEYGFTWDDGREKNLERFASISRRVRPWIPTVLAIHPKAWTMERKVRGNNLLGTRLGA
jgi:uncharacterized protein (DUF2236 family)